MPVGLNFVLKYIYIFFIFTVELAYSDTLLEQHSLRATSFIRSP